MVKYIDDFESRRPDPQPQICKYPGVALNKLLKKDEQNRMASKRLSEPITPDIDEQE